MYIYFGWMYYSPYALYEPFYLVIETDFRFGAPVRAFWKWTVDGSGNKNVNKLCWGSIDRAEAADSPTAGTTYGIFYDLYYPFDLFISDDQSQISLTMFELAKSDPNCSQVATFDLVRVFSGRTTADDYDPVVALPDIRYYQLSTWFDNLFGMIVPANLCQDGTIWVTFDDNEYVYFESVSMSVVNQSDDDITVTFSVDEYSFKIKLDKADDYWECESVTVDDSSSTSSTSSTSSDSTYSTWSWTTHAARATVGARASSVAGKPKRYRLKRHTGRPLAAAQTSDKIATPKGKLSWSGLRTTENSRFGPELSEFFLNFFLSRTVSKVVNDTGGDGQAVFCKLEESGTSLKGKVLAGVGMGLAVLGILPLGGFSTPVAIYGILLAGVGLYDALNDASAEVERLLFPGDEMTRRTSGGIPIGDNNDLIITFAEIKDKLLYFRVGMKERVGEDTVYLSKALAEKNLFKNLLEISFTDFDGKTIQACKFVKMTHLVPVLSPEASISQLSDDVLYNLDDGQIISDNAGEESIYDTLNTTTQSNDVLFNFSASQVHATLIHAYVKDSDRNHDVIAIPSSNLVVVKLKKATISINDAYCYSLAVSIQAESDVYSRVKADAGYIAYSWSWNSYVFGYKLDDLVNQSASVIATSDTNDRVYIATHGWLPWQRIVSTS